ncbi:hypothetical protein GQX74_015765 [Glossina fuscipes]|nr:hypothetical protein GQX74_015765 [Glossina fuscipes]
MLILGIETSCDDTGIAIYDTNNGLIINKIINQAKSHAYHGGIVPEIASKLHLKYIQPSIKTVLKNSKILVSKIGGIAYTAGPGLERSLAIGATFASSLAYSLNIPSVGVHHLEGHLLTPMFEKKKPNFPFLGLIISGAHTQLILANKIGKYKILGNCMDDALGEAFDKTAKLLGINYPGGKKLSILAQYVQNKHFNLIESLAEEIADMLVNNFSIPFVKITVNKPSAILEASNVGVTIIRRIKLK